jgi:endonuclease V-like protein UPF0215 family
VVGVAFSELRLEGVLSTRIRRDGANATNAVAEMIERSQFAAHTEAVLFQGIAMGGFNVVDLQALHERLGVAVLVVARRTPNLRAIESALRSKVKGGERKWALVQRAGEMEPCAGLWVQRAGITLAEAESLIRRLAVHGTIPEPLRVAHLIAGGMATGRSRGRA